MFENVQFFSHLHLKYAKRAIMTQKFFFLTNINMGIKKRRILCWFQICWCRLKQMPLKKARAKKLCKFWVFSILCIFHGFLLLTFVRGISESRHQWIWNQHKILRIFYTHIDIFKGKNCWVIIALFVILKCKCEKNWEQFWEYCGAASLFHLCLLWTQFWNTSHSITIWSRNTL